ncbi:MAG: DUF4316 domain-containing protein [Alphaproteobacteria bacterium]|nr:DUF4316 domain-containing protein [Alphaproteobacteria bacterium]
MADERTEKQKVQEITDKLEKGLKELFESEKYKTYLSTMSKFHNYSFNNTLLIAMQKPEATLVAGYKAWQKNFERHVNKGEKAIRILAPAPYKIKEERDKLDPVTGEMMFDDNGMPQKEEVEVTIPAFRAVSVFDVSQTDGKPIPELETQELLSTVEGYEDFVRAVINVAPVPIDFEDIPGESKGYFHTEEKRIAVQENMSESQTLKTMVHEVAHSMLHDREINRDNVLDEPAKDRNTKEVEAESIAYTVCQHFGIDTSDYSFGYIAGWSSGKDMKELKSSLDTIRKTASQLITGIEEQLQELQLNRTMEQMQDITLLVRNSDLTEYELLNIRGMETEAFLDSLLAMNDNDRLSVAAYLESKGAWTTVLAEEQTEEVEEYHLDYIYDTDTQKITNVKEWEKMKEKALEPILASDVLVKVAGSMESEYEIDKITNMTAEQVKGILYDMAILDENEWNGNVQEYLKDRGAEFIPIMSSAGLNDGYPQFYDFAYDTKVQEVMAATELSVMKQAENLINRIEFGATVFTEDERNLIVNYAYKLDDMDKTRTLAEKLAYQIENEPVNEPLTVIEARAEINALPDPLIGLSEMREYGYTWNEMLPLTQEMALELFDHDMPVYLLYEDGSETTVDDRKQITEHKGIFGVEKGDWENERNLRSMQEELAESGANREAKLLYGSSDKYGIYQLKHDPELNHLRFEGTASLKRMGITKDNVDAIKPDNYELIYVGELSELQKQTQGATLEAIYEKFNIDHPADYKGHSLSVSDIVVLHQDGENTAHFVDSFGFTGLPNFLENPEPAQEQEVDEDEIIDLGDEKEQVLAEMKKTLVLEQETSEQELAFSIADRYICIHEVDGGYDYSIMDTDYHEIDGGVYDNPDVTIREALNDIVEDLKSAPDHNGAKGNIQIKDELIPIDYDGLREKVEEANRIVPENIQNSVVADFKAKTNELFHDISELNPSEIEETIKTHVQAKIDEYAIDAKIVDVAVVGSRCRGLERESSDLDVVVELSTYEREDDLFNAFNEDGLHIGDVKVDINPITARFTGTLETYLPQVEDYLSQKQVVMQQESVIEDVKEDKEKVVTLTVAECGEFHNLGEYHEGIAGVEEALAIYKQIPPERMNGIPSIGINIHTEGTESYQDIELDILSGNVIDLEILDYIPEITNNSKAMEVIAELVEKVPDAEVRGSLEKWQATLLAVEIDQFSYDFDTYQYKDTVDDRDNQIQSIADDIRSGNIGYLNDFLNAVISEGVKDGISDIFGEGTHIDDSEAIKSARKAKELLDKLAEYKPLAKIEEIEESNYNMIDNMLNNGSEKVQREVVKKEQEKMVPRTSLKARLTEKQAQVAGQGKEYEAQENTKKNQREM